MALNIRDISSPDVSPDQEKNEAWWTVQAKGDTGISSVISTGYLIYTVTLDDITRNGGHFADMFPELIPGENISIEVICESTETNAAITSKTVTCNSLFSSLADNNETEVTANISMLRHFENLDPAVSGLPQTLDEVMGMENGEVWSRQAKRLVTKAVQQTKPSKSMDYLHVERMDKSTVVNPLNGASIYAAEGKGKLTEGGLLGVYNPKLTEYVGNGQTISNVKIEGSQFPELEGHAGLFREISNTFTVSNLNLKDFDVSGNGSAGTLIGQIDAENAVDIKKVNVTNETGGVRGNGESSESGGLIGAAKSSVNVDNCIVTGTVEGVSAAGGLIGYLADNGKITNSGCIGIATENTYHASKYSVAGDNAGGLIGKAGKSVAVKDCVANIKVSGTTGGGLIGVIDGGSTIENSYSAGFTQSGKYSALDEDFNVQGETVAGGLVGNLLGTATTIRNCYSTCSAKGGTAGGFIGSENLSNTYNDSYATGLVKGTTAGAFIGVSKSAETAFKNCAYLYAINEVGTRAAGSGNCGAVEKHYVEMPRPLGVIFTKSSEHQGKAYPFKSVNKLGLSQTQEGVYIGSHFGDWPVELQIDDIQGLGTCNVAYREKVEIDGQISYQWYIKTVINNNGKWDIGTFDNLIYDNNDENVKIIEYSYGVLLKNKQDLKPPQGNISQFTVEDGGLIIDGEQYKYYRYLFKNQSNSTLLPDKNTGIVNLGTLAIAGANRSVTLYFNPNFGAAIAVDDSTQLGNSMKSAYQIRTEEQLENIATSNSDYNRDRVFNQTMDIKLMNNSNFKPIGGDDGFLGTYDASYTNKITGEEYTYRIKNFNQNNSNLPGMFSIIGKGAKVSNVNLQGSIIASGDNIPNIGTITGKLDGIVEHCKSNVSVQATISAGNEDCNIGGLIGTASAGSVIHESGYNYDKNAQFPFRIVASAFDKQKQLNIGGLVGFCDGTVEESHSDVDIHTQLTTDAKKSIGGFIGRLGENGKVKTSWSKMKWTDEGNNSTNLSLGGFIGTIASTVSAAAEDVVDNVESLIQNCYAVVCGTDVLHLFIGNDESTKDGQYSAENCHAVLVNNEGNLICVKPPYLFGGKQNNNCYMYAEGDATENGVILLPDKYNLLNSFQKDDNSLSSELWEVKDNGKYPTLKSNPEPSAATEESDTSEN